MATKNHYVWVSRRKRLYKIKRHDSQEPLCLGFKKEKTISNNEAWQPRTTMFGLQERNDYQIRRHVSQEPLCLGFKKEKTKIK